MARIIIDTVVNGPDEFSLRSVRESLSGKRILETQSDGAIHSVLNGLPGYVCSEYFEHIPSGKPGPRNIRCEDLQALSFPDCSFDLVVTQDVLEHVRHPAKALSEIRRILIPGGHHIFSVPMYLSRRETIPLVDVSGKEDRFLVPPVYHRDSFRLEGTLVYNDFGTDLIRTIDSFGMRTSVLRSTPLDEERFRIFHSYIFVSRRI